MGLKEVQEFIHSCGYDFDPSLINSKWQKTIDKNGHKVWYIGTDHGNDLLTFTFGDFREPDKKFTFTSKTSLTAVDEAKLKKFNERVEKDKSLREEITKEIVQNLVNGWSSFCDLGENADYLESKNIPRPPDVIVRRSTEDNQKILVIPMQDTKNEVWNIQQIYAGGDKTFHPGARVKGCFYTFGHAITTPILIGEGFATCAALHLATGLTTVCAFNISNLESAVRSLIERGVPSQSIVLCADFDGETFKRTGKNPGMLAAQKLTEKYKIGWVAPVRNFEVEQNFDFADLWYAADQERGADIIRGLVSDVGYYPRLEHLRFHVKPDPETGSVPEKEACEVPEVTETIQLTDEEKREPGAPGAMDRPHLHINRCGELWVPVTHTIQTRNAGYHETVIGRGKAVRYEPIYTDLRLRFEEEHPFVTHLESETVFTFNGKVYQFCPELYMLAFAEKHFDPKPKNGIAKEFVGSVTRYNVHGDEFFNTKKKINFQNGWLDLNDMTFRPHGPHVGFKNVLDYEFDPEATCPEFDLFLLRICCGDQALADLIMEYVGYILSGDECWTQQAMVFKGEGSNGKSTLLRLVRNLIGNSNVLSARIGDFGNEYYRNNLNGKLACIAEETPKDALLESSYFKEIVAGGTIGARAPYGCPYNFEVKAKLLFSCNDMPPTGDSSHALLRRLLIVPFNHTFSKSEADPFIHIRLNKELPGIFNRALKAYLTLLARGQFERVEAVEKAVNEYKISTSPVHQWLEEKVKIHPVNDETAKMHSSNDGLFADFKMWCEASGYRVMNANTFGKNLGRAIPDIKLRRDYFGPKSDRYRGLVAVTDRKNKPFLSAQQLGLGI